MRLAVSVVTLVLGVGVAAAEPVKHAAVKPHPAFTGSPPAQAFVGSAQDESDGNALLDATWAVVQTASFQDHVAETQNLHVSARHGAVVDGEELVTRYLRDREPTAFFLEKKRSENGHTGYMAKNKRFETRIDVAVLALWRSDNEYAKACAINTVAHEWTHAISDGTSSHTQRYTDDGWKGATVPLVSFTVGSIAQCTRLGLTDAAFWTCVERAGIHSFDAAPRHGKGICTDGDWLK